MQAVPSPTAAARTIRKSSPLTVSVVCDVRDVWGYPIAVADRDQLVTRVIPVGSAAGRRVSGAISPGILFAQHAAVGVVGVGGHIVQRVPDCSDVGKAVIGVGLDRVSLAILLVEHRAVRVVVGD